MISHDFIRRIPKSDLHLHLDGSLRLSTLIELAREAKVTLPSTREDGLRELVFKERYANLADYLTGFGYTCAVLNDVERLEWVAYELVEDNIREGVRYIEVRFAPQLHMRAGLGPGAVVSAVVKGLDAAAAAFNRSPAVQSGDDAPFRFGIICCAMRTFRAGMGEHLSDLVRLLPAMPGKELSALASLEMARIAVSLRDNEGLPIVGFDLAGEEFGYPASVHAAAFQYAHRHFLKKTVHAGEAYGPESIFLALTECHANRIGHGTLLFSTDRIQDPEIQDRERYCRQLAEHIASERICIEVCLTSNLQTLPGLKDVEQHSVREMLARELSVAVCTDNRLVSNTTVTGELMLLADSFNVTPHQFRNVIFAGFKGAFFPGSYKEKREYFRIIGAIYERELARELAKAR